MDRGQFVLHYQPVIELSMGAAVGAEALLRWIIRFAQRLNAR